MNYELFELLGWKCQVDTRGDEQPTHLWMRKPGEWAHAPDYLHDHSAMHQVYPVLKERGLWPAFIGSWAVAQGIETYGAGVDLDWRMLYDFLTDTKGQVEAAVKVLTEASNES